jgi:hypothetical protein
MSASVDAIHAGNGKIKLLVKPDGHGPFSVEH